MARLSLKEALEWAENHGYDHTVKNGNKHTLTNPLLGIREFQSGTEVVRWVKAQQEDQQRAARRDMEAEVWIETGAQGTPPTGIVDLRDYLRDDIPTFDSPLEDLRF